MKLLPGPAHFHVDELPLYAPSGSGEHCYVQIEKEGLTTDAVQDALARCCGIATREIGYAGRKDRHAVTTQWFSLRIRDAAVLDHLADHVRGGRVAVRQITRHGNKLRLGHLAGNRFRLGLAEVHDVDGLTRRLHEMQEQGVLNRFGPQRFGIAGANVRVAQAWARGDHDSAVALLVDPHGDWQVGQPLPEGFRPGPEGRVLGSLRKGAPPRQAFRAAGPQMLDLLVSAAQSAIFNAVLDARVAAGLLHRFRIGDLGLTSFGAAFSVAADALEDTNRRAAPGVLDAFTTGPLPGSSRLQPAPDIDAEERAWAASTGCDVAWFARGGPLEAPGERRSLVMRLLEPPTVAVADGITWLSFALPSGGYATEVLAQAGIAIPADRR
jgi:tRNA pseudouridine13 synthase